MNMEKIYSLIEQVEDKKNFGGALAECYAIMRSIEKEYGGKATVEAVRADHPELDFMDDDEIEEIIELGRKVK